MALCTSATAFAAPRPALSPRAAPARIPGARSTPLRRLASRTLRSRAPQPPRALLDGSLHDALAAGAAAAPSWLDAAAAHLAVLADADAAPAAAAAAADAAGAAADGAAKGGGFFGFFSDSFEAFLKVLDDALERAGVPYSYGFAIIILTLLVKVATYPLTKKQVESTLAMQALAPRVKDVQARFAGDAERVQLETARLYQDAGVNPLAGCLPTLATIPVFIGLYRALSNVANEGLLTDGFFWIPSLAGPTGGKLNGGLDWLFKWVDGAPALGYADTAAYLVLPVALVASQYVSMKVISPAASQDPQQQQAQAILKFLPVMIGWFSLNVPSGLSLYWLTNNVLTTAQQLYLRRRVAAELEAAGGPGGAATGKPVPFVAGRAGSGSDDEGPKRPSGRELNARRAASAVIDVEAEPVAGQQQQQQQPRAGGSRGEKFRSIKAKEAMRKAAAQTSSSSSNGAAAAEQQQAAEGTAAVSVDDKPAVPDAPPPPMAKGGSGGGGGGGKRKKGGKK